ncbi:MAG: hypothetical protein LBQ91_01525 [Oscillospiraceae bacterium]|jgi:hypothetical protein|nr:hypothetical protein [Oscillospiraceae bacterium]
MKNIMPQKTRIVCAALLALAAALLLAACSGKDSATAPRPLPSEPPAEYTYYSNLRCELDIPENPGQRDPRFVTDTNAVQNLYPLLYAALSDGKDVAAEKLPKSGGRCRFEVTFQEGSTVTTVTGWSKNLIHWNTFEYDLNTSLPSGKYAAINNADYYAKVSDKAIAEITAFLAELPTDLDAAALDNILAGNNGVEEKTIPLREIREAKLSAPLSYVLNPKHGNAPETGKIKVSDEQASSWFYKILTDVLTQGWNADRASVDLASAKCHFILSPRYIHSLGGTELYISCWEGNVLYWRETNWSDEIEINIDEDGTRYRDNYSRNGCYIQLTDESMARLIAALEDLEQYKDEDKFLFGAPVFRQD